MNPCGDDIPTDPGTDRHHQRTPVLVSGQMDLGDSSASHRPSSFRAVAPFFAVPTVCW